MKESLYIFDLLVSFLKFKYDGDAVVKKQTNKQKIQNKTKKEKTTTVSKAQYNKIWKHFHGKEIIYNTASFLWRAPPQPSNKIANTELEKIL